MWFLTNRRMDNADLVLEKQPPKLLKIRQVVDYFFGVGDEESSEPSPSKSKASATTSGPSEAGIKALRSFLDDAGFGDLESNSTKSRIENVSSTREARAELTNASAAADRSAPRSQASSATSSAERQQSPGGPRLNCVTGRRS